MYQTLRQGNCSRLQEVIGFLYRALVVVQLLLNPKIEKRGHFYCVNKWRLEFELVDWLIWSGPSRTSTPIPHWFRSREWTPRRKLGGTPESAWLISTRLRWRRTGATTVAFGERFPGHTVTPALFVLSSLPICPPNPWYSLNWNCCLISVTLYNGFCLKTGFDWFLLWCFGRVLEWGCSCIPAIYKVLH